MCALYCVVCLHPNAKLEKIQALMMRLIYTFLLYCATPLILLRLLWRARKSPAYAKRWSERFGFISAPLWKPLETLQSANVESTATQQKIIWLHSVSVGETIAAAPLVRGLLKDDRHRIVITTTTPTGSEQVRQLFSEAIAAKQIHHVYAPYDLPDCIARFLKKVRPDLLVIMETELWPNTIAQCVKKSIPVVLANGRLSEKSAKGYQKIKPLIGDTFQQLSFAAIQHKDDAQRMLSLGLRPEACEVTGNIKFDLTLNDDIQANAKAFKTRLNQTKDRVVWIAASTHKGEDEIILDAFKTVKESVENALLILVPRHPERFDSVATQCQKSGFSIQRRSDNEILLDNTDILVGDTMGELLMLLGASDIAFIGGSFVPVGGHNMIEAAAWGLPILNGPHYFNFNEAMQLLLNEKAVCVVENAQQLSEKVIMLAQDSARNDVTKQSMGQRARDVALANRGALDKLLIIVKQQLQ